MIDMKNLTYRQRLKVEKIILNDWQDVKVYLEESDLRDIPKTKKSLHYPSIRIEWTFKGERCMTRIPGRTGRYYK